MTRRVFGWRDWTWIVAAFVLAVALGWVIHEVGQQRDRIAALTAALESEQDATRGRGQTPVAPAPSELVEDPAMPVPGPQGEPGRDGVDGSPGVPGSPGAPGSPGRDGIDGSPGAAGAEGSPGADGAPGVDGRDGVDGQPPASWTWTDERGRRHTCTRDEGSPDSAPTYTCTAEPRPGPIP